jgi:hypothetical protein
MWPTADNKEWLDAIKADMARVANNPFMSPQQLRGLAGLGGTIVTPGLDFGFSEGGTQASEPTGNEIGDTSSIGTNAIQISSPDANGMARFSDGTSRYVGVNQINKIDNGGGVGGTGTGTGGTGIDIGSIVDKQRNNHLNEIQSYLDSARDLRDETSRMIDKKRDQYKDLWTEGQKDINNTFEGEKGNARRTFADLTSTEGNRARALGLGGSATDYADSRRSEQMGRQLGDINTNNSNNQMENKRTFDNRNTQADSWQEEADRNYNNAEQTAQTARNSASDTADNTMLGWLGQLIQNQNAINAVKGGIGADVANPYAVDTSKLTSFLNSNLGGGTTSTGTTQDGNPVDNALLLANLKKNQSNLYGVRQ